MNPLHYLGAIAMFAGGTLAYLGRWRSWARAGRGFGTTGGFGLWWIGTALLLALAALTVGHAGEVLFTVLVVLAAACMFIGFIGLRWLPPFLLPAWYRTARADRAEYERREGLR